MFQLFKSAHRWARASRTVCADQCVTHFVWILNIFVYFSYIKYPNRRRGLFEQLNIISNNGSSSNRKKEWISMKRIERIAMESSSSGFSCKRMWKHSHSAIFDFFFHFCLLNALTPSWKEVFSFQLAYLLTCCFENYFLLFFSLKTSFPLSPTRIAQPSKAAAAASLCLFVLEKRKNEVAKEKSKKKFETNTKNNFRSVISKIVLLSLNCFLSYSPTTPTPAVSRKSSRVQFEFLCVSRISSRKCGIKMCSKNLSCSRLKLLLV